MTPICHARWLEHPGFVAGQRVRVQMGKGHGVSTRRFI